jgi:hypothetical protein
VVAQPLTRLGAAEASHGTRVFEVRGSVRVRIPALHHAAFRISDSLIISDD